MVRFARIKGVNSKASFNKAPEEASSWSELKQSVQGASDYEEPEEVDAKKQQIVEKNTNIEPEWCEFDNEKEDGKSKGEEGDAERKKKKKKKKNKKLRLDKETEGLEFKRRKEEEDDSLLSIDGKEVKLVKFDGYSVTEEDGERLEKLRTQLSQSGKNEKEIYSLVKIERRKAERFVKTKKRNLCFHCRKGGHNLSDCPELKAPSSGSGPIPFDANGGGICFKCGSSEHRLPQCKSKSSTLDFATCFICGQSGHLSKNCSNNPRGLYPDGGGCKTCGEVTHYARDCPQLANKKRKRDSVTTAKIIDYDNIEALDYDEEEINPTKKMPKILVQKKGPNKIIKF